MTLFDRVPVSRARRRILLAAAVVLLTVVGVVLALGLGGDEPTPDAPSAGSTQPSVSVAPPELAPAPVTPEPSGPTEDATEPPSSLAPVAFDEEAAVGNGITARVVSMEAVDGTGQGPGNIAGPALRVTVRITNGTAAPVSLDGVAVDLAHGTELTPASPLDDPSASPFAGTVQPSGDAVGVYVFTVPTDDRELVHLSVGYQAGAPFLVFTGSAA